ncbi:ERG4/ERG24 ergosterol biosynthesis protein, partial [Exidia glandulosa HHB12029]
ARFLVFYPVSLSYAQISAIIVVQAVGYYIFRASNGEKNDFRNGRNPKNLRNMTTESGRKLLISGWWGFLRHPNYLGDLLMALAWSLPTGFDAPLTYFYFVYFFILLVHRNERDNDECHKKYGKDWERYTNLVPYSIIP